MKSRNAFQTPSTPFPNQLLDQLMPSLKDTEWRLVCVVVRQTLGWVDKGGRKTSDWLSPRQLIKRTGRSSEAISRALAVLVQRRIMEVRNSRGLPPETPAQRRQARGSLRCALNPRLIKSPVQHGVELITLHDATDTATAAGRFMESMLVAAKTYDREQTSEKVRTKMRMRLEKGLHHGGLIPFGFLADTTTKLLSPDESKLGLLEQVFQAYVDTNSHFAVRQWLKDHQVPSPRGEALWKVSSIRDLLSNRRYIAEIEINRNNKGVKGVPEELAYRIVPAAHKPLVPRDLFDAAQAIQKEKGLASPNRRGRSHSFSNNRCDRVFLLQNRMVCGVCGASMTPYYVVHKPGKHRRNYSYIHYYICANQHMNRRHNVGHTNRVLAKISESWIVDQINDMVAKPDIVERAFEAAREQFNANSRPQMEALARVRRALELNKAEIDKIVETITSGSVTSSLITILDAKAHALMLESERLKAEQRALQASLHPADTQFDALPFRETLNEFRTLAEGADPAKVQKLLRLTVKKMEWQPSGDHVVEFYQLPKSKGGRLEPRLENWLVSNEWSDTPGHTNVELVILDVSFVQHLAFCLQSARLTTAT